MNEHDKNDTETLRKLITEAGFVLDHPILLKIVESAPSPKAADEYILSLGWPNGLAHRVRQAVKLKQKYPEIWNELLKGSKGLNGFFEWYFNGDNIRYPRPLTKIRYHEGGLTGLNSEEGINTSSWPYWLGEIIFSDDKGKKVVDTFNLGDKPDARLDIDNNVVTDDIFSIKNPIRDYKAYGVYEQNFANYSIVLSKGKDNGCGHSMLVIKSKESNWIKIRSQYLTIKQSSNWQPAIYKVTELYTTSLHKQMLDFGYIENDTWTFFMRVDKYGKNIPDGHILYKRTLHIYDEKKSRVSMLEAQVKIEVYNNVCHILNTENNPHIIIVPLIPTLPDKILEIQATATIKMNKYISDIYQFICGTNAVCHLSGAFGLFIEDILNSRVSLFDLARNNPTLK